MRNPPHMQSNQVINRAALVLRYKSPAVQWINDADPRPDSRTLSLDEVNEDQLVYLIRDEDADSPSHVEKWVRRNFKSLFENELSGWYTDPSLWPNPLTYQLFQGWFEVECHSMVVDTVGEVIKSEEI